MNEDLYSLRQQTNLQLLIRYSPGSSKYFCPTLDCHICLALRGHVKGLVSSAPHSDVTVQAVRSTPPQDCQSPLLMHPTARDFSNTLGGRRGQAPTSCDDPMATGISACHFSPFVFLLWDKCSALDAPFFAGKALKSRDTSGTPRKRSASLTTWLGGNSDLRQEFLPRGQKQCQGKEKSQYPPRDWRHCCVILTPRRQGHLTHPQANPQSAGYTRSALKQIGGLAHSRINLPHGAAGG